MVNRYFFLVYVDYVLLSVCADHAGGVSLSDFKRKRIDGVGVKVFAGNLYLNVFGDSFSSGYGQCGVVNLQVVCCQESRAEQR